MKNIVNPKLLFVFWTMVVIFMAVAVNGQFLAFKNDGEVKGITAAAVVPINIEVFKTTGQAPFTVLFNAVSASSDIASYEWDFGDINANVDNPPTDQGRMVGHRFDTPGTYIVTLEVRAVNGDTGTATKTIVVEDILGPSGNTYYISSSVTSDGDGSEGSPWTLDQFNLATIANGSRILFKRGETFTFTTNWNISYLTRVYPYITIGAYGSGINPKIYTPKITNDGTIEGKGIILSDLEFNDRIEIKPKYYSSGPVVGFHAPGLQVTLRNIKAKSIIIYESDGVVLENVIIDNKMLPNTGSKGILVEGHKTDTMEYIYFNKVEVFDVLGHCVYFAGGGNNILIENSKFHDCGAYYGQIPGANIRDGLTIHGNSDNVVVRNNDFYNNGYAFGFDSAYDISSGLYAGQILPAELMTNFLFEGNKVYSQVNHVSQIRSLQDSIFRNNVFYDNPNIIFGIYGPKFYTDEAEWLDANTQNLEIYNNTFYNNRNTNYFYIGAFSTPNNNHLITESITIKNNIISSNTGTGNRVLIENTGSLANLQFSNNIYFNLGGGTQFNALSGNYTLDDWLDPDFGQESGSYNTDPLFVSPATYDFHLVDDISPAINAGATINNAYDYSGELRTAGLDIGAYENLSGVSPPCEPDWSSWTSWSECIENTQTRTRTDLNNCNPGANEEVESQTCSTTTPSCQENWSCSAWGPCTGSPERTDRICTDGNVCETTIIKPAESLLCAPIPGCEPSWGCTAWGECDGSGFKSRSCSDSQNCGTADGLPSESASCAYCNP